MICELEKVQEVRRQFLSSSTQTKPIRAEHSNNLVDEKAIESEIKREINGVEQQSSMKLQMLGSNAREHVGQAMDALFRCANKDDVQNVLETLIERVVAPTLDTKQQEAEVYKAKYMIAKKACHIQSAQIEKRDQEILELKDMVKFWMREVDNSKNQTPMEPNRDVY